MSLYVLAPYAQWDGLRLGKRLHQRVNLRQHMHMMVAIYMRWRFTKYGNKFVILANQLIVDFIQIKLCRLGLFP
ncbi:hypothetical protein CR62_15605 [Serratia grimesii]|uniref:Uncharacterized protein n=1 Tax=Serratia grimesii TaxID=82995 RepID=A0ABR4U6A4_9GAMM|nr:hypothetical protein CR62_15605 [Serratia grimesii]